MMKIRQSLIGLTASVALIVGSGCIVVGAGWNWSHCGPVVWTEKVTERVPIDPAGLKAVEARTHNGEISFSGQPADSTEAFVVVTKKAGGLTLSDAEEALEAINVYVRRTASHTVRIGWKWRGIRRSNWGAQVGFEIRAPGNVRMTGETHNGGMDIKGVAGEVRAVTHNGSVAVESAGGGLYVETHNGRILAAYSGDDVTLITHNGEVVADLHRCATLDARITTHNGGIEVAVGETTSADLRCETHNGRIKCDVPLNVTEVSRHMLTGTIGGGDGYLNIITHNGGIRIKKTAG
jgi:DUF4097 and DUF4098 domain-containing protein YvlB